MVRVRKQNDNNEIRLRSSCSMGNVSAYNNTDIIAAGLAKDWAIKTVGTVDGSEYSSKYYSNQAKTYAQSANSYKDDCQSILALAKAQADIAEAYAEQAKTTILNNQPKATTETLGAVIVGDNLAIDSDGILSADVSQEDLTLKQDILTAGDGIDITDNVISNTQISAVWGNITGDLSNQTDLQNALVNKANAEDIPTKTSDLTNDSGFITSDYHDSTKYDASNPNGYITSSSVGNGTITITQGGVTKGSFTTNQSGNTTVEVDAGGGSEWGSITGTLSNQTDLNTALSGKQATLVSGTNIKTINSNSLLGSGNLTISGGHTWATSSSSVSATTPTVVKNEYISGTSGYRIWTDGYCEQWGRFSVSSVGEATISLTKRMADTNYIVCAHNYASAFKNDTGASNRNTAANYSCIVHNLTQNSFSARSSTEVNITHIGWRVFGYLASGQY